MCQGLGFREVVEPFFALLAAPAFFNIGSHYFVDCPCDWLRHLLNGVA